MQEGMLQLSQDRQNPTHSSKFLLVVGFCTKTALPKAAGNALKTSPLVS